MKEKKVGAIKDYMKICTVGCRTRLHGFIFTTDAFVSVPHWMNDSVSVCTFARVCVWLCSF